MLRKTNNKRETKYAKERLFLRTGVTSKGSVLCGSGFKYFKVVGLDKYMHNNL